ncbi:MAG: DUF835 domain-containing protein, partial [Thaumarchaeota archaeon]|nr:DUF835 domain-containing protein [Nitrososphaerota archaeon]
MPDAVVVYRIFGLSVSAIFSLARLVVTPVIIFFTLRIPFKRNYHWMFLIWTICTLWLTAFLSLAQLSTDVATAWEFNKLAGFFAGTTFGTTLVFQFVVYFVSRRASPWQKLVLVGGYTFVAATRWIPAFIDPSFISSPPHLTIFGWTLGSGTGAVYLMPSGIDLYDTGMTILTFYMLFRHYRSDKSPLVRGQTRYLIVGLLFGLMSDYAHFIQVDVTGGPSFAQLFGSAESLVLLLGLRKKGFFSATPVVETTAGEPIKYPVEDGHAYLGLGQKTSFMLLSDLVRGGRNGLCITTTPPDEVRLTYRFGNTPIRWLAQSEKSEVIDPGDLAGVFSSIVKFIQKAERPVVLIDGIDYLVSSNGFRPTMAMIDKISKTNSAKRGVLLISSPIEGKDVGAPAPLEMHLEASLVQARLKGPQAMEAGETGEFQLDIFNVGMGPAIVEEVKGIVPDGFTPVAAPRYCQFRETSLLLRGKRLEPLQTESIVFSLRAGEPGEGVLSPELGYRYGGSEGESSYSMQSLRILVSPPQKLEFEAPGAEPLFAYLVREFRQDYMLSRHPIDQSGWRS